PRADARHGRQTCPRPSWPGAFFRIGLLTEVTLQQTSEGLAVAGWPPRIRSVGEPPAGFDLLWAESIRPKPRGWLRHPLVTKLAPADKRAPGQVGRGRFFRIGLLTEVTLQQTSEGLAVAGFVAGHLVDGVVDGVQVECLGALGQVGLA